jgi:hypothetical protein
MADTPTASPGGPASGERLNGWKDIAAYLGKSVRTAQRWEAELRLPARRIHTAAGEIVYASRRELDEWLHRVGDTRAETPAPEASSVHDVLAIATSADGVRDRAAWPRGGHRRAWIAASALIAVLAVSLYFSLSRRLDRKIASTVAGGSQVNSSGAPSQPVRGMVQGDRLRIFGARDELLWEYRFDGPLREDDYRGEGGPPMLAFHDLDGDGTQEVLFRELPAAPLVPDRFHCFESDGTRRFTYEPPALIRFGATNYGAPFSVGRFAITPEPDGHSTIWLVVQHYHEFPTLVQKLDPRGERLGEYWANGHSVVLAPATIDNRRVMLVGGTSNETQGAALTVLDHDRPAGSVPADDPEYRCSTCPPGAPLAYLVFPKTEVCARVGQKACVWEVIPEADRIRVGVVQGAVMPGDARPIPAMVYYTFDASLHLVRAEMDDAYKQGHVRLEREHLLDHPWDPREAAALFPVLSWGGHRFVKIAGPQ